MFIFCLPHSGVFFRTRPALETSDAPERLPVPMGVAAPVLKVLHPTWSPVHLRGSQVLSRGWDWKISQDYERTRGLQKIARGKGGYPWGSFHVTPRNIPQLLSAPRGGRYRGTTETLPGDRSHCLPPQEAANPRGGKAGQKNP